mmetsp:Transcript_40400/g.40975  ORF Transcript_40400/g.40975 Transcript_40400/m.40975 type:complete len:112 (-) Transcript_40400:419-754(-)
MMYHSIIIIILLEDLQLSIPINVPNVVGAFREKKREVPDGTGMKAHYTLWELWKRDEGDSDSDSKSDHQLQHQVTKCTKIVTEYCTSTHDLPQLNKVRSTLSSISEHPGLL